MLILILFHKTSIFIDDTCQLLWEFFKLFHEILMMLFSLIPLLFWVYSFKLIIKIIELWSNILHFFEYELESL